LAFSSAVLAQVTCWEVGEPVVDLAGDDPSKGAAVDLTEPRTLVAADLVRPEPLTCDDVV